MRFMIMHKMTPELESGLPPDPEVIAGVDQLITEGLAAGAFQGGEGLKPSAQRTQLVYRGGKRQVTDGPFTEAKELIGGFALMRVQSREEALDWCDKFAACVGDVELHLGPVVEPWDLGMMDRPKNPPLRYLSLVMLDPHKPQTHDPSVDAKMGALIAEMSAAGAMQATGGLAGPSEGARIRFKNSKPTVMDGPFAESKELIAGYAIMELPSKASAIEWAIRFGNVVRVNEVEVRLLPDLLVMGQPG